jgi:hypothetical protein
MLLRQSLLAGPLTSQGKHVIIRRLLGEHMQSPSITMSSHMQIQSYQKIFFKTVSLNLYRFFSSRFSGQYSAPTTYIEIILYYMFK